MLLCASNIAHHPDSKSEKNCYLHLKKLTVPTTTVYHSSRCFLLVDCVLSAQQRFLCFVAVTGAPICHHCGPPIFFRYGPSWLLITQLHLLMAQRCWTGPLRFLALQSASVAVISHTARKAIGKKQECRMWEWQRVKSGKLCGRSPAFYQVTTKSSKRLHWV